MLSEPLFVLIAVVVLGVIVSSVLFRAGHDVVAGYVIIASLVVGTVLAALTQALFPNN